MPSYIVAITGASGALYGVRLIDELLKRGDDVELFISPSGFLLLKEELGIEARGKDAGRAVSGHIGALRGRDRKGQRRPFAADKEGSLHYTPSEDISSPFASGSYLSGVKAMIICPCSMGTLGRIAGGVSGNLIERAADCMLKERKDLILVPRETPLSAIHLENMLKLSRAGAVMLPAMPAFYNKPESVADMADFVVGKVLDVLKIDNSLYKRWKK